MKIKRKHMEEIAQVVEDAFWSKNPDQTYCIPVDHATGTALVNVLALLDTYGVSAA